MAFVLAAAGVYAIVPTSAFAGSRHGANTPADRAAVHAYLTAQYEYVETASEAAPAAVAAFEVRARAIASECPSALAGAPQGTAIEALTPTKRPSARQRGEERRQQTQLGDLHNEIDASLISAEQPPLRSARLALLAKLKALPQGPLVLAALVKVNVSGIEEDLARETPNVCADIDAWITSGYRSLSPASRAIALHREATAVTGLRGALEQLSGDPLASLESPADRTLASRTAQTQSQVALTITNSLLVAVQHMEAALGLKTHELPKPTKPKSTTRIGAGRTAAGTRYVVSVERTKSGGSGCKTQVQIRPAEDGASGALGQLIEILGSEPLFCLSSSADTEPQTQCSEGLIEIRARLLPATRTVVLRLSDGRLVVSRPVLVPARLGGPAAIYYQAVRGPSPVPVSLIERDAHGHTLQALKLRQIVGCSKHPLQYLPGGKPTLVHGRTPQGPVFSIVGERYRLFGRLHVQLKLRTGEGLVSFGEDEDEEEGPDEGPSRSSSLPAGRKAPLDSEVSAGCHPHEYSIFYGLLKQPRDTVLAKVAGKLVAVLRVGIPASLHAGGVLVYLASDSQPEEIVVRSPSGKVVTSEDLSRASTEGRETCEGESEGLGPPPGGGFGEAGETSRIVLED